MKLFCVLFNALKLQVGHKNNLGTVMTLNNKKMIYTCSDYYGCLSVSGEWENHAVEARTSLHVILAREAATAIRVPAAGPPVCPPAL